MWSRGIFFFFFSFFTWLYKELLCTDLKVQKQSRGSLSVAKHQSRSREMESTKSFQETSTKQNMQIKQIMTYQSILFPFLAFKRLLYKHIPYISMCFGPLVQLLVRTKNGGKVLSVLFYLPLCMSHQSFLYFFFLKYLYLILNLLKYPSLEDGAPTSYECPRLLHPLSWRLGSK